MTLRASSLTAAWIRAALLVLLAVPPLLFSVHMADQLVSAIAMAKETLTWPSTSGHVTFSGSVVPKSTGKTTSEVRFNYVVGGITFEAQRPQYGSSMHHHDVAREFPVGPARVYYSPKNPKDAVLRTGLAPGTLLVIALAAAIGGIPAIYLLWKAIIEVRKAM